MNIVTDTIHVVVENPEVITSGKMFLEGVSIAAPIIETVVVVLGGLWAYRKYRNKSIDEYKNSKLREILEANNICRTKCSEINHKIAQIYNSRDENVISSFEGIIDDVYDLYKSSSACSSNIATLIFLLLGLLRNLKKYIDQGYEVDAQPLLGFISFNLAKCIRYSSLSPVLHVGKKIKKKYWGRNHFNYLDDNEFTELTDIKQGITTSSKSAYAMSFVNSAIKSPVILIAICAEKTISNFSLFMLSHLTQLKIYAPVQLESNPGDSFAKMIGHKLVLVSISNVRTFSTSKGEFDSVKFYYYHSSKLASSLKIIPLLIDTLTGIEYDQNSFTLRKEHKLENCYSIMIRIEKLKSNFRKSKKLIMKDLRK